MGTKKHYKMYKNGKNWCYAAIATLAVAFGVMVSGQPAAQADTVNQPATTAVTSTTSATSQQHPLLIKLQPLTKHNKTRLLLGNQATHL